MDSRPDAVGQAARAADSMICPNCGARDPFPPTESDNATTTCPKCGHRFPVTDGPEPSARREE
jgi:hypothetical protein